MKAMLDHRTAVCSNIETLRLLAVVALVSYHAIGSTPQFALQIEYPHPLRLMADGLIDLRMPLFAFISGWVYSISPVGLNGFDRFFWAKVRRLYVPGVAAALVFWVFSTFAVPDSIAQDSSIWEVFTLSYVHYWFLQSIFLILVCAAFFGSLTKEAFSPLLLMAVAFILMSLPGIAMPGFSLEGPQYLAPFFIMGILFFRGEDWIIRYRAAVTVFAMSAFVFGITLNIESLQMTGELSTDRRNFQSTLVSLGGITLLMLYLPRINCLAGFGSVAFTIYLYHVFGTSGMRRATEVLGIDSIWLIYILCVVAGFGVPYAIHQLFSNTPVARAIILGLRPDRVSLRNKHNRRDRA